MTLIRSNPSFKSERARLFFDRFNFRKIPLDGVSRIFRQMDLLGNAINEKTGNNMDAEELHLMVIGAMNDYDDSVKEVDVARLYEDMEELFLAYPPVLYEEKTLPVLEALHARPGCTCSLLSNTAFIKGKTLRKTLPGLGLGDLFDFALYSDEAGMSKPNKALFRLMLDTAAVKRGGIDPGDVIHIGDNPVADGEGARAAGIESWLVNSNNRSIASLINQ
jgi:putative hydrolase of the HAD superfamily